MRAFIPKRSTILLALVLGLVTSYLSAPAACLLAHWTGWQWGPEDVTVDREPHGWWTITAREDAAFGMKRWQLTFKEAGWKNRPLPGDSPKRDLPSWLWYTDPAGPGARGAALLGVMSHNIEAGMPVRFGRGSSMIWADRAGVTKTDRFTIRLPMTNVVVPLRPEPIRYSVNSLLHAGFWLLFPMNIRWRRIRKNRYPACGYDQSGTPDGAACPECGRQAKGATA